MSKNTCSVIGCENVARLWYLGLKPTTGKMVGICERSRFLCDACSYQIGQHLLNLMDHILTGADLIPYRHRTQQQRVKKP